MPTLDPENLTPEETTRKNAYDETRAVHRRRKRLYGEHTQNEYRSREEASFLVDSTVGRITAMNTSDLPRRRLGSLHQGLHYTGNDPLFVDFHLCSRDIETRENADDLIALDLETDGRLWLLAQSTLNLDTVPFFYLLTQEKMFQDLWGEIPNRRRYNLNHAKNVRDGKSNTTLPKDEQSRLPTLEDLAPAAQVLLQGYDDWTRADTGPKKDQWFALVDSLGFDQVKMCRRIHRIILMTGRAESYFLFKYMLDNKQINMGDVRRAIQADEDHMSVVASSTMKGRRKRKATTSQKISSARSTAKYYEEKRLRLSLKRGIERDEGAINHAMRKRDEFIAQLEALKLQREAEKEASNRLREGKNRGKRASLKALSDDDCFNKAVDDNFETVKKLVEKHRK